MVLCYWLQIADSFPGMEQYAEAPVVQPPHHAHVAVDLRKAPKWLKRPVGASFGVSGITNIGSRLVESSVKNL